MIKRRGSVMPAIFDFLYREYCRARLAEMRKQLLLVSTRDYENLISRVSGNLNMCTGGA